MIINKGPGGATQIHVPAGPRVDFGLDLAGGDLVGNNGVLDGENSPRKPQSEEDLRRTGAARRELKESPGFQNFGKGLGSQIVWSYLTTTGNAEKNGQGQEKSMVWQTPRSDRSKMPGVLRSAGDMMARDSPRPTKEQLEKLHAASIQEGGDGDNGIFLALLLNDTGPVSAEEMTKVTSHRWYFKCAEDLAGSSKAFYCFVRCLLEISKNVQVRQEGDLLSKTLVQACKTFVGGQCREGKMGQMYQFLTHFLANSPIFVEWGRFLDPVFEDARAKEEAFLVPHLEQVWIRFCRFRTVIEEIFKVLDSQFVWQHRLPKVGVLLSEHMRRRCFSSKACLQNELFATEKCQNESIKKIKYEFKFS